MNKNILHNWTYVLWFLFYYILFALIFGGSGQSFLIIGLIYVGAIGFSLTASAENFYRNVNGIRELRTKEEKDILVKPFEEVYSQALTVNKNLSQNINIYIMDTMEVNAFAFGRQTLCITKGSIELLEHKYLAGLIAHEFGHFSNYDTIALLTSVIGNIFLTFFTKFLFLSLRIIKGLFPNEDRDFMVKILEKTVSIIYRAIIFTGDIILMNTSRQGEYLADRFACECGYGKELHSALKELNLLYNQNPEKFFEQLRSTHPPISRRLQEIEMYIDRQDENYIDDVDYDSEYEDYTNDYEDYNEIEDDICDNDYYDDDNDDYEDNEDNEDEYDPTLPDDEFPLWEGLFDLAGFIKISEVSRQDD